MDLSKMKVGDLRKELKARGLSTTGTKAELLDRLQQFQADESNFDLEAELGAADQSTDDPKLEEDDEKLDDEDDDEKLIAEPEDSVANIPDSSDTAKKIQVSTLKTMTEQERLALRNKKFGSSVAANVDDTPTTDTITPAVEIRTTGTVKVTGAANEDDYLKMKKRAERFGTSVSSKMIEIEADAKKRERALRFQGTAAKKTTITTITAPTVTEEVSPPKRKHAPIVWDCDKKQKV